jgi:hypothetical protein
MANEIYKEIEKLREQGLWPDELLRERMMVECKKCPICRARLTYVGLSSLTVHYSFGACLRCEYGRLFSADVTPPVERKILLPELAAK